MLPLVDMTGERCGRLLVLERGTCRNGTKAELAWLCRCDCGREKVVRERHLRSGASKSCGCFRGARPKWETPRGETRHGHRTPEYKAWGALRDRCLNPGSRSWHRYGGRGITVCERWANSYADFLADMGRRPSPSHSIDRINNDGNYEPGNCRWATHEEQMSNRDVPSGERHCCARLTEDAVRTIRHSPELGTTLAARFGVAKATIGDIRQRRTWRHIV